MRACRDCEIRRVSENRRIGKLRTTQNYTAADDEPLNLRPQNRDWDPAGYPGRTAVGVRHVVLEMLHVRRKLHRAARARRQAGESVVADDSMQTRMDVQPHDDTVRLDRCRGNGENARCPSIFDARRFVVSLPIVTFLRV